MKSRTSGHRAPAAEASAARRKRAATGRTPPPAPSTGQPRLRLAPTSPAGSAAPATGGRPGGRWGGRSIGRLGRYLSCLRLPEILVLQGSPLLGAACAIDLRAAADTPPLAPLALLTVANVCLMAHVFLLNDWSGLTADRADPNKAAGVFTARGVGRGEIGALAAGLLALSLLLFSRLGPGALALALAIATLSALYSLPQFDWKGRPLLNSAAHLAGGTLHFLLGYSLGSPIDRRGLATAAFFALTFAAGHLTQEVRDHQGDVLSAIRTNAVIFGPRRTFGASLALFTLAHALLVLLALQGTLPRPLAALAIFYPLHLRWSLQTLAGGLTYASVRRLQARYRVLYALIGLAMVAALWFS